MVTSSLFYLESDQFIKFKLRPRMTNYGVISLRVLQYGKQYKFMKLITAKLCNVQVWFVFNSKLLQLRVYSVHCRSE